MSRAGGGEEKQQRRLRSGLGDGSKTARAKDPRSQTEKILRRKE
jgi:hypothetical protein